MRIFILFYATILLSALGCSNGLDSSFDKNIGVYADSLFQASIDSSEIAGASIIVYKNDKILYKKSYGYASIELSSPMPEEPVFEIGSVTKQFTAAAILKLVEDKKLSLEDDFTDYIDFDTKGRRITINNLLTHTSGIQGYTEIPEFSELSIKEFPRDSLIRLIEQKEFLFEPNEVLIYNNTGYFLLGLIIEKISGKTYDEFLKETFFQPLGMKNTHYSSNTEVIKSKVYGYSYTTEGLKQKPYLDHTWPYSAGSLCSSASDLLIWMTALHKRIILPDSLYQSLITCAELKDGAQTHYAKGLVNYLNSGHREIAHGGGINGFLTETRYYPDEDLYVICLVNTTGPKGALYFAEKITWKLIEKNSLSSVDVDIDLENLEGKYLGVARGSSQIVEINALANGLVRNYINSNKIDTLINYIGNNTWMDGNKIVTIKNDEYRVDNIYGFYIFKKVEN